MKFLVIGRNMGAEHGMEGTADHARENANAIRGLIEDGTIEAAYALLAGGHVYVVNADSAEELAVKVRTNKLFSSSATEIHPIADAVSYLEGWTKYLD